jgi:thiol peroxidase
MATVTLKGNTVRLSGNLPKVGNTAPEFTLVDKDLQDRHLKDFGNKRKILYIVPSLDTAVCSLSTKKFYENVQKKPELTLIVASADLPFAQKRFCSAEQLDKANTLSMLRSKDFAKDYGVLIEDSPLAGLCTRAVLVLDKDNKVIYTELVKEISQEPNYDKVLEAALTS